MKIKYQRKPVVVEAFQMTEARMKVNADWPQWLHEAWNKPRFGVGSLGYLDEGLLCLSTAKALEIVRPNDWLVANENGELSAHFYAEFHALYEPVDKRTDQQVLTDEATRQNLTPLQEQGLVGLVLSGKVNLLK